MGVPNVDKKIFFSLAADIKILRIENDTERIAIGELNELFYGKDHNGDCTPVPVLQYQSEETDFEPQKSVKVTASIMCALTHCTQPIGRTLLIHLWNKRHIPQAQLPRPSQKDFYQIKLISLRKNYTLVYPTSS